MVKPGMNDWLDELPATLKDLAFPMNEVELPSVCFQREAALGVARAMRESSRPCLGGDEWIWRDDLRRPTFANWHIESEPREQMRKYVSRSWDEAERFIEGRSQQDATYVFVVGD